MSVAEYTSNEGKQIQRWSSLYVAELNRSSAALPQAVLNDKGTVSIDLPLCRLSDIMLKTKCKRINTV